MRVWTDDWTDNTDINYENPIVSEDFSSAFANLNQDLRLRSCNLFIQRVNQRTNISIKDKLKWIAEARFSRALVNYYMAQRFGGIYLVEDVINNEDEYKKIKRSTIDQTYNSIINDLQYASKNLPLITATPERATKWAAMGMITRVALQAASYLPAKRNHYLNLVVSNTERIMKNKRLQLDSSYKDLFNDYDKAIKSKEILFGYFTKASEYNIFSTSMGYINPSQENGKMLPGFGPQLKIGFDGWPQRFPSQNLVDAYEVIDEDGKAKYWESTIYYKNYKQKGGYVSSFLYKNRDKRFYATIVQDSSEFIKEKILTREKGNMNNLSRGVGSDRWGVSSSNYYFRKSFYEKKRYSSSDTTNHHQPIIRLAEVYLNYAETLLLLNHADEAVKIINKTRILHGGLPPLGKLLLSELWQAYKNERRVELSFENDRYWSLLRWAKFDGKTKIPELVVPIRGVNISYDGKRFSFNNILSFNNTKNRKFTSDRFLFPFPNDQYKHYSSNIIIKKGGQ